MTNLTILIPGIPVPQGSHRHVGNGRMVEANAALAPWRADAIAAIRAACGPDWLPITSPVFLEVKFAFTRPKGHYRTGRNAGLLKASAPVWKTSAPDLDKLLRALGDALTQAGAWRDDSLLVGIDAVKGYGTSGPSTFVRLTA